MGELPVLHDDGAIRWASRDAVLAEWDRSVGRGVVVVQTTRTFAPLELLQVRLEADGVALDLEAEVIRPEVGRATLRLTGGPVPLPAALLMRPASNPFAAAPVVVAAAHNPFATAPAPAPPARPTPATASPTTSNPFGLRSEPLIPVLRLADDDDDGVMPPPPPSARAAPPPPKAHAEDDDAADVMPPPAPVLPLEASQMTSTSMKVIALDDASPSLPALATDQVTSTSMKVVVVAEPTVAPTTPGTATPGTPTPTPPTTPAPPPAPPPAPAVVVPTVAAEQTSTTIRVLALDPPDPPARPPTTPTVELPRPAVPTQAVMAPPPPTTTTTTTRSLSTPMPTPPLASATQGIDAAPLRTVLPPYFSGDCLRFNGVDDLRAARGDLQTVGALLAVSDGAPPATAVEVRVAAGSVESRLRVKVTISGAQKGTVVVQAARREDWKAVLDEVEHPPTATSAPVMSVTAATPSAGPTSVTGSVPAALTSSGSSSSSSGSGSVGGVALQFARKGQLTNPVTVQGILAMPLHRSVTEHDLKAPSVPLLLRWLRTTRGIFRLDLNADGVPAYTCIVVDGREIRSSVSLPALGKSMAHHKFTYELTELPRAPTMSHTGRSLHLIIEVVRGLLAHHEPDEIAAVFPHIKDGRAVRAVVSVADALGFQGPHARLVKSSLQGDVTVAQVARSAHGGRTAWDVLIALELFGGLVFAGPGVEVAANADQTITGAFAPAAVERPAVLDKDHFGVLGLHWSCAPGEIAEAWQRARREYGPGGFRRPTDPAIADEVMKKVDDAWRTLGNVESRRTYRRATFNMVWPHQAQLLVQQAKLAIYRKDAIEARGLLEAAEDMAPSPEAQHLLAGLNKKA